VFVTGSVTCLDYAKVYIVDDVNSGNAKININLTWDSSLLRRSGTVGLTLSSLLGVDGCSCSATAFTLQFHMRH